uniref:Sporulation related domain-containing protein n=1 Tax=Candidatus Kentrum sp. LFY TaxID=2126342 RepID=A0A450UHF1_9GAMM|nr:MAG: hypothetical protein BECKLFY1418A_GA0070994_101932 [Candidatus Kentron sp. LFY]
MKWVFYLLVVINLVYFAWETWHVESSTMFSSAEAPKPSLPDHVDRLLLFHEVDPDQLQLRMPATSGTPPAIPAAPAVSTSSPASPASPASMAPAVAAVTSTPPRQESAPVTTSSPVTTSVSTTKPDPATQLAAEVHHDEKDSPICYRVGPLSRKTDIDGVKTWLQGQGITASQIHERRKVPFHWVYFPPFKTRIEALGYVERLKRDGIEDIHLLSRGKMNNAVSLGVFSKRTSLKRRVAELRKKGYIPSVGSRLRTQKITWLETVSSATFPNVDFNRKFSSFKVIETECNN